LSRVTDCTYKSTTPKEFRMSASSLSHLTPSQRDQYRRVNALCRVTALMGALLVIWHADWLGMLLLLATPILFDRYAPEDLSNVFFSAEAKRLSQRWRKIRVAGQLLVVVGAYLLLTTQWWYLESSHWTKLVGLLLLVGGVILSEMNNPNAIRGRMTAHDATQ
jgi:hypothetical protein